MNKPFSMLVVVLALICAGEAWTAERLAVTVPLAIIRSGPGEKYPMLWKVEKYYPIIVIEKTDKWYYFKDFEGDMGWISETLVGKIPTVVVKNNKCNVRSGPDETNDILFTVEKGVSFKVLETKENWIHVLHADGDKGWIFKSLTW